MQSAAVTARGNTPSEPSAAHAGTRSSVATPTPELQRVTVSHSVTSAGGEPVTLRRSRPLHREPCATLALRQARAPRRCIIAARALACNGIRDADDEGRPRRRELRDAPKLPGVDERLGHELFPEEYVCGAARERVDGASEIADRDEREVLDGPTLAPARARMP